MKRIITLLRLLALVSALCGQDVAATEYVLVNNNNYIANTAILYRLDTGTGVLTKTDVLRDGGQGIQDEVDSYQIEQAVTQDAGCIFVFDTGSSDIAAFSERTKYYRVGKYFNSKLIANGRGGSLALTPNGRFLYASYSETENMGA